MFSDEESWDEALNELNLDLDDGEDQVEEADEEDEVIPGTEAELKKRLKTAVMYSVKQICEHEENELNVVLDKAFVPVLTELVMDQIENIATDLQAFATHAKRSTVQIDDVMLLARRQTELKQHLEDHAFKMAANKKEKKKRAPPKKKPPITID